MFLLLKAIQWWWIFLICRIRPTIACCCFCQVDMSLISLLFRASVSKVQCYFMWWVISIVLSLFVRSKESFESFNVDIVRLQMLRFVKSFARRKGLRRTMVVLRMPMLWTCAQTLIISWAVCAIVFIVDNTFCRTKAERVFVFLLSWFFCWTYPWWWNMYRIRQTKTCCCFFRLCLWIHVLVFRASVSKVQWFFLRWVISIVPSQFV